MCLSFCVSVYSVYQKTHAQSPLNVHINAKAPDLTQPMDFQWKSQAFKQKAHTSQLIIPASREVLKVDHKVKVVAV